MEAKMEQQNRVKIYSCVFILKSLLWLAYPSQGICQVNPNELDSLSQKVVKVDIRNYLHKEIYFFMLNDSIRKWYSTWEYMDYDKPFSLSGIYLTKSLSDTKSLDIRLFVSEFKHIPRVSKDMNWEFRELLKESISGISVYIHEKGKPPLLLMKCGEVY
jgi:hypothetical protein